MLLHLNFTLKFIFLIFHPSCSQSHFTLPLKWSIQYHKFYKHWPGCLLEGLISSPSVRLVGLSWDVALWFFSASGDTNVTCLLGTCVASSWAQLSCENWSPLSPPSYLTAAPMVFSYSPNKRLKRPPQFWTPLLLHAVTCIYLLLEVFPSSFLVFDQILLIPLKGSQRKPPLSSWASRWY